MGWSKFSVGLDAGEPVPAQPYDQEADDRPRGPRRPRHVRGAGAGALLDARSIA